MVLKELRDFVDQGGIIDQNEHFRVRLVGLIVGSSTKEIILETIY